MEKNRLIKYNSWQLRKVQNLIAITDKILETKDQEQIKISYEENNDGEIDKRILTMQAIKALVIKARTWHDKKLAAELKNQNKSQTFDEK